MKIETFPYHPRSEQIVDVLTTRVQNNDRAFFRLTTYYYLCKLASNMHVTIKTVTNNSLPVNCFALSFAESGYGKNYSLSILEDQIFGKFREAFVHSTFINAANKSIVQKANEIAVRSGEDIADLEAELTLEFQKAGHIFFDFSEGTVPALKQVRRPMLLAKAGAVSLELDELGQSFLNMRELLTALLELYDVGKIKEKLVKSSAENARGRSLSGNTPTNFFGFGTPQNVFDGGSTEDAMRAFFDIGYARRSFFAYGDQPRTLGTKTTDEIYNELMGANQTNIVSTLANHFESLADLSLANTVLPVGETASRFYIDYQLFCTRRAEKMNPYRPIEKVEMGNRHVKALKLAGAMAFADKEQEITVQYLKYAIKATEESGIALSKLLNQPRAYVRLANFLSQYGQAVTEADLVELLPFYKGTVTNKRDMIKLATAHGHRNAIAITQYKEADVTFYKGSQLVPNDNSELVLTHSKDIADNYTNSTHSASVLAAKFFSKQNIHYCNHHLKNGEVGKGHRCKQGVLEGFNYAIFDIDDGKLAPQTLSKLLGNVNHIIATTKSHTDKNPRYRLILPLSHKLFLNDEQYKQYCTNLAFWLPVPADTSAFQREKKFRTWNTAKVWSKLDGENLNAMRFYPSTAISDELVTEQGKVVNLKGLQRWVVVNCIMGQRNQIMYRYACILAEYGKSQDFIADKLKEVNGLLQDPLSADELDSTVLKSIQQKVTI